VATTTRMDILGAMRRAAMAGLTAATLLSASPTWAAGSAGRVALDWREVSDSDVERCGLSRLRSGTLERLVDEGYAVVDDVGDDGVSVRVSSTPNGLRIVVETGEVTRDQMLPISDSCDATFGLEAISRIAELVNAVQKEAGSSSAPTDQPAEAGAEPATFGLSVDATLKTSRPDELLLFGGGMNGGLRFTGGWTLGGRAEITGNARLGVTLLEIESALTAAWKPEGANVGMVAEVGPILHLGNSDRLSATEVDALHGAGIEISMDRFFLRGLGTARLRRFEHRVGQETAFDTGHLGLILRLGAQLLDG
jgi:hypothetical protein